MPANKKPPPVRTKTGGGLRRTGAWSPWLVFSAAALVALLLYLPTLKYGFVWDDGVLILNNPYLTRTNPIDLLTKGFWNNPETELGEVEMTYYRPLTNISFFIDRKVWGLRPTGYHLTNVIVNAAVVLLMSLLLWELFGSVWLAGLGGLLVGIHPAMNCVVTFVSNRTYLLALFFLLAGSYALLRGRRDRARVWPALSGFSLLLSALALESSLAFAAVATAWLIVNRARYRELWAWMAAIALPIAVYFLLRLGIARVPFTSSVVSQAITDPLRVVNAFGQQVQLLLFPFNQKVLYVPAGPFISFSVYTVLGLLFLGLPLYAVIRLGRSTVGRQETGSASSSPKPRHSARPERDAIRLSWYGYAWMVLFLLPFAHLVVLGPAGRMLYLAAPGMLILLAALYRATDHKRQTSRIVYGVVLLYAAAFAVQTLRRNPIWRDELSLTQAMVREAPESAGGHLNYGMALAGAGRMAEATEQLRMAVGIDPDYPESRLSLAFALIDQGDLPGAIRELREAVRLQPESPKALNDLGYAYLASGDFPRAIASLKAALRLKPDLEFARRNLAEAYRAAGMPDSAARVESGKW